MTWTGKQHPVETLVELLAPAVLAAALGWSAWATGSSRPAIIVAAGLAMAAGWLLLRTIGAAEAAARGSFEPLVFDMCAADPATDELLLDNPLVEDELLLDDPLTEVEPDARVVRLFARHESTPGELVSRIADFLGDDRRGPTTEQSVAERPIPDASIALHAALANIRASLR